MRSTTGSARPAIGFASSSGPGMTTSLRVWLMPTVAVASGSAWAHGVSARASKGTSHLTPPAPLSEAERGEQAGESNKLSFSPWLSLPCSPLSASERGAGGVRFLMS